jgi:hypothetical protein
METVRVVYLQCGFFIIVLDLRLTKIELGNSGEFPFLFISIIMISHYQ